MRLKVSIPVQVMALLFASLIIWMAGRFAVLMFSEPAPAIMRGTNPTNWVTEFGFIILMSLMTLCVMWMVDSQDQQNRPSSGEIDTAR